MFYCDVRCVILFVFFPVSFQYPSSSISIFLPDIMPRIRILLPSSSDLWIFKKRLQMQRFVRKEKGVIAHCCNNHITWCFINDIAWRTETRSSEMNIARSSHTLPLLLMKLLLLSLLTMLFDVMLFSRFMLFFMIFRGISKVFPGYFQYISKVLCDGWMDRIDGWTPSRLLHTYDYNITFGQT